MRIELHAHELQTGNFNMISEVYTEGRVKYDSQLDNAALKIVGEK